MAQTLGRSDENLRHNKLSEIRKRGRIQVKHGTILKLIFCIFMYTQPIPIENAFLRRF